jgi:hypothetical protein
VRGAILLYPEKIPLRGAILDKYIASEGRGERYPETNFPCEVLSTKNVPVVGLSQKIQCGELSRKKYIAVCNPEKQSLRGTIQKKIPLRAVIKQNSPSQFFFWIGLGTRFL